MNGDAGSPARTGSEHGGEEGRLWGFLQDLLAAHGRLRTAELLGVSERTLRRAQEAGRLTKPLANALQRHAATSPGPDSSLQGVTVALADLTQRLDALEQHPAEAPAALRAELAELVAANQELQGRVTELERRGTGEPVSVLDANASTDPSSSSAPMSRRYPQIITAEAEAGEERVYRAATPLIVEWRLQRNRSLAAEYGFDRLTTELRLTELEVELVETYQLTLPPADTPWNGLRRHSELRRRYRSLERLRRQRRRARLRRWALRLLTLGWRGR